MSGLKTILFWLFVLLALGMGVFAYFELRENKKPKQDPLFFLPSECLLYLGTNDFFELTNKINSQSLITDKLQLVPEINAFSEILNEFDSLFSSVDLLRKQIDKNLIHFALYKNEEWLTAIAIKELGEAELVTIDMNKQFLARNFEDGIFAFLIGNKKCFYKLQNGIVLISNSNELLKKSTEAATPKLNNNIYFKSNKLALSETSILSIFIDHEKYSKSSAAEKLNLAFLTGLGFSSGVVDLQPSEVKINGYFDPDTSAIFKSLLNQKPQSTQNLGSILPANTVFFQAFGFDDYRKLMEPFVSATKNPFWEKTEKLALFNVEKEFIDNISNHLVNFHGPDNEEIITVDIKDSLIADEHIQLMSDSTFFVDSLIVFRTGAKKGIAIFSPLIWQKTQYMVRWGNHLYFSHTINGMQSLLNSLQKNALAERNESFNSYNKQHFNEEYNFILYNSPARTKHIKNKFFNFKIKKGTKPFENFKHLSYSIVSNSNNFKFRFHLLHETEEKQKNVLWTFNHDTTLTSPIFPFVNHLTKENELCVQDAADNLLLLNAKGGILWKKSIGEKILSQVYMVDIYRNNKYQLLFNTRTMLHLIDRNGRYVEGYPVKLPSPATNPLSVFDYENTNEHRLFIACKNKVIYNYSLNGVKQEGFVPVKTDNEVKLPLQYVVVDQSQYLIAIDEEGKIYTFSRRGLGRIGLRNRTVAGCDAFYVDPSNSINSTYLIYLDNKNSLINKISFADKKEIYQIQNDNEVSSVVFDRADDNKSVDLLVTDGNSIKAFDFTGSQIFNKTLSSPLSQARTFTDESHSLLYALTADSTSLILHNELSKRETLIPATSMPHISNLFKNNKKYMLVVNGKQISCLLLN